MYNPLEWVKWCGYQKTTNEGPMLDDVFWILGTKTFSLRFPQGTSGDKILLERLQQLPNFDNEAVISAMACSENKIFICWQREAGKTS